MYTRNLLVKSGLMAIILLCGHSAAAAEFSCGTGHINVFHVRQSNQMEVWISLDNSLQSQLPSPDSFAKEGDTSYIVVSNIGNDDTNRFRFDMFYRTLHAAFLSGAPVRVWSRGAKCRELRPDSLVLKVCAADSIVPCAPNEG